MLNGSVSVTVIFTLVIFGQTNGYAGTIFSENFEVNNISDLTSKGWGVGNGTELDGTPVLSIVPAPSGRSGKVLRMQYQGIHVDDNHNAKIVRTFPDSPEIFEKYYVLYQPINTSQPWGYTPITSKQHYLKTNTGLPNFLTNFYWDEPFMGMGSQKQSSQTCPNGAVDVTCNLYANKAQIPMNDQRWHCVESHVKFNTPNTPDGVAELWIDGTQTLSITNGLWRDSTTTNTAFSYVEVYRQGGDNMYRFEDDYVMATSRVGCSGSPMSLPPTAPKNLTVI